MSAQQNKEAHLALNKYKKDQSEKIENKRPNIDHLLKKINVEKKKEKKNNLIMIVVGSTVIAAVSLVFTQV